MCCIISFLFSRASFENLPDKWVPELRHFCPNIPIVVVATKKDVRPTAPQQDSGNKGDKQFVWPGEGLAMAKSIGKCFTEIVVIVKFSFNEDVDRGFE